MAAKHFSIKEAISYGWKQATTKIGFFVILLIIMVLVSIIPGQIATSAYESNSQVISFIAQLINWALQLLISVGLIHIALKLHDKKKVSYKDLFTEYKLVIPYFIASIIYTVIIIVGFILLIVPGIIWAIKFRYFSYLIVDKHLGPIDALKRSSKITQGIKMRLLLFSLALIGINILGALALLVGLLITIPLSMMAEAYVYRKLTS